MVCKIMRVEIKKGVRSWKTLMKIWALLLNSKELLTEFEQCHKTLDLHFRIILSSEDKIDWRGKDVEAKQGIVASVT